MKFFTNNKITALVIALVLIVAGLYTWSVVRNSRLADVQPSDADFALGLREGDSGYTDLNGNRVVVSDYIGSVIIINSWASWSPASAAELQMLERIAANYSNEKITFLAINRSEPAKTAKQFLQVYKITNQVMLLLDPDDKFYRSISGYTMPETLIYDKKGAVYHHFRGKLNETEVRNKLDILVENS